VNLRTVVTRHFEAVARDGSYPQLYSSATHTLQNHDFLARVRCVERLLAEPLKPGVVVLDLGCGPAPISGFVLSRGAKYVGVDVSQAMLDSIEKRDGLELRLGSSEAIPYEDGCFDVVVGMGLIEYFDNPRPTLLEMARVTRPGGLALITVPNRRSVNRFIMRHSAVITMLYQMRRPAPPEIAHHEFSPNDLETQMVPLGFELTAHEFYDFKLISYPLTRIWPNFAFMVNKPMEGKLPGLFANGYIGLFQKK
jgi:SAM-dependent methyltransferase